MISIYYFNLYLLMDNLKELTAIKANNSKSTIGHVQPLFI